MSEDPFIKRTIALSEDKQQLLWSEQSASISRLHKRIDTLESEVDQWHECFVRVDTLEVWMKEIHDAYVELAHPEGRMATLETWQRHHVDGHKEIDEKIGILEAACIICVREGDK